MVEPAPSAPSSPAGPPAPGRSASRSASDRREAIEVLPENDALEHLARRRPDGAVAASCIGRARPHRGNSHRGRRRFSGPTRDGRYCRARYYHPGLQRFISEDPIGFAGGDPNLYAYVGNNPLSFRDPLGNIAIADDAAIVIIGAAALGAMWLASDQGQQAMRDTIEGAQQLAGTTMEALQSLMGRRQRESGLENLSDEEIARRARDKSLPTEERLRYVREEKNRKMRNKGKDRGGPVRPMGFMGLDLSLPWEAIELNSAVPLSGRKR